jgi:hypothetical protein
MADPQQKVRRDSFMKKTIAVSLLVVLLSVILGLLYAKSVVNRLTELQPATLPTVQLSEIQMFQLHDRVDTFRDAVRDNDPTPPLELSADELNALVETDPAFAALKNHLFISIKGDQLGAQISFPAEDLGLYKLRGRYVNATGVFHVAMVTNELMITAESLSVRDEPLPRHIMQEVAAENLADRFNQDPKAAAGLQKIQSIDVKDGKWIVVPKK